MNFDLKEKEKENDKNNIVWDECKNNLSGITVRTLSNAYEQRYQTLSLAERKSLIHYTSTEHAPINRLLRGDITQEELGLYRYCACINKAVNISYAIQKIKIREDLTVYRGMRYRRLAGSETFQPEDLVGKEYADKGFMSTSLMKSEAERFGDILLKINLKNGDKAAYISGLSIKKREHEVLIDKEQTLVIHSLKKEGGSILYTCSLKRQNAEKT